MTTLFVRQRSNSKVSNCLSRAVDIMGRSPYKLKDYQVGGVKWMLDKELNTAFKGGILADDPGLGKTIQCAGLIVGNPLEKTLIIVPTSVINQWVKTLGQVIDPAKIYLHHGGSKAKTPWNLMSRDFKVCITSHGSCFTASGNKKSKTNNVKTILHHLSWDRIIIDEGHVIRNSSTKIHKACCQYTNLINKKWILSGTPIQNSNKDMINILKFVGMSPSIIRQNLEAVVSKYVLRRTKNILMVDKSFQDYEVINNVVKFDTRDEQNIYEEIQTNAINELLKKEEELKSSELNLLILELLLRLRQASSHPGIALKSLANKYTDHILEKNFSLKRESSKMKKVVQDISISRGYCLVFCHFKAETEFLEYFLEKKGISSEIYSGALSREQRDVVINKFDDEPVKKILFKSNNKTRIVESKARVLIIQIKAGGVGLNLQQFNNVFILAPDWNPANEIQAIARAHRMGQTKKVNVNKYTLVYNPEFMGKDDESRTSVDERILGIQCRKRDVMVEILNDPTLTFCEKCSISGKTNQSDLKFMLGR